MPSKMTNRTHKAHVLYPVTGVEQQRDIMDIMRCVNDAAEGTVVHVPDVMNDGYVKKYVCRNKSWIFINRMTVAEAENDDSNTVDGDCVDEAESVARALTNAKKDKVKKVAASKRKGEDANDDDEAVFTLTELKDCLLEFEIDKAVKMVEKMIEVLGDDVMKGVPAKKVRAKKSAGIASLPPSWASPTASSTQARCRMPICRAGWLRPMPWCCHRNPKGWPMPGWNRSRAGRRS